MSFSYCALSTTLRTPRKVVVVCRSEISCRIPAIMPSVAPDNSSSSPTGHATGSGPGKRTRAPVRELRRTSTSRAGFQDAYRFPHRRSAHVELRHKLGLVREEVAVLESFVDDHPA